MPLGRWTPLDSRVSKFCCSPKFSCSLSASLFILNPFHSSRFLSSTPTPLILFHSQSCLMLLRSCQARSFHKLVCSHPTCLYLGLKVQRLRCLFYSTPNHLPVPLALDTPITVPPGNIPVFSGIFNFFSTSPEPTHKQVYSSHNPNPNHTK